MKTLNISYQKISLNFFLQILIQTNVTNSDMDGTNVRRKQSSSSRETKSSYNQNSFMDIDEEVNSYILLKFYKYCFIQNFEI